MSAPPETITTEVEVRHLELVDSSSSKFYRSYVSLGRTNRAQGGSSTQVVFQWGRRGAIGQCKPGLAGGAWTAREQLRAKEAKGYVEVAEVVAAVPMAALIDPAAPGRLAQLDQGFHQAWAGEWAARLGGLGHALSSAGGDTAVVYLPGLAAEAPLRPWGAEVSALIEAVPHVAGPEGCLALVPAGAAEWLVRHVGGRPQVGRSSPGTAVGGAGTAGDDVVVLETTLELHRSGLALDEALRAARLVLGRDDPQQS